MFWLSGEMDHDLKVLPVAHVALKLQAAKSFFEARAAHLVLPAGNRTLEVMALIDQMGLEGRGCEVHWVASARDLMAALDLSRPPASAAPPRPGRRRTAAGLALLLLGSVTAFTHLPAQEVVEAFPAVPASAAAPEEPALQLVALETRAAPEGNCAEVTLGRVAAETRELPLRGGERQVSRQLDRLCGLGYRAVNAGPAAEIWLIAARAGGDAARLHAKVFASALPLATGESATFEVKLPRRFDDALEHLFLLVARPPGGEPPPPLPDARPTRDAWDAWVEALVDRGFAPTAAAHLLSPEEAFF